MLTTPQCCVRQGPKQFPQQWTNRAHRQIRFRLRMGSCGLLLHLDSFILPRWRSGTKRQDIQLKSQTVFLQGQRPQQEHEEQQKPWQLHRLKQRILVKNMDHNTKNTIFRTMTQQRQANLRQMCQVPNYLYHHMQKEFRCMLLVRSLKL